jgi:hypothetical protein
MSNTPAPIDFLLFNHPQTRQAPIGLPAQTETSGPVAAQLALEKLKAEYQQALDRGDTRLAESLHWRLSHRAHDAEHERIGRLSRQCDGPQGRKLEDGERAKLEKDLVGIDSQTITEQNRKARWLKRAKEDPSEKVFAKLHGCDERLSNLALRKRFIEERFQEAALFEESSTRAARNKSAMQKNAEEQAEWKTKLHRLDELEREKSQLRESMK